MCKVMGVLETTALTICSLAPGSSSLSFFTRFVSLGSLGDNVQCIGGIYIYIYTTFYGNQIKVELLNYFGPPPPRWTLVENQGYTVYMHVYNLRFANEILVSCYPFPRNC